MVRSVNPFATWSGAIVLVTAMLTAPHAARADDTNNGSVPLEPLPATTSVPADPTDPPPPPADPRFPGSDANAAPAAPQNVDPSDPAYDVNADTDPAALTDFREALDPYGTWQDDPTYGVVWVPNPSEVGTDFAPYVTAGHWGVDDGGQWIWVSDYNWGWAPFHYGRWVWIAHRGWGWVPGRVYAPAWVVWRTGYYDDYYVGWAPMAPTWGWYGGFAVGLRFRPWLPFVFCSSRHMFAPHVYAHIVPAAHVGVIAGRTQPYFRPTVSAGGGYHALAMTRGPSFAAAHVPASAIPAQRTAVDPRAAAFAHGPTRVYRGNEGLGLAHSRTLGSGYTSRPVLPPTSGVRTYPPSYRSAPSYGPSYRSAPSYVPSPGRSAPAYTPHASGSFSYAAPRPVMPSSPSMHAPPSVGSFHSTAPSYHAPSFHGGGAVRSGGSFHAGGFHGGGHR